MTWIRGGFVEPMEINCIDVDAAICMFSIELLFGKADVMNIPKGDSNA
ncbi:MAG: hypothetical protein QXG46_00700 [Ignisphaera sp.]